MNINEMRHTHGTEQHGAQRNVTQRLDRNNAPLSGNSIDFVINP